MTMRLTLTKFTKNDNRLSVDKLFKRYKEVEVNIIDEVTASAIFEHSDLASSVVIVHSAEKQLFRNESTNQLPQLRHIPYKDIDEVEVTITVDGSLNSFLFPLMLAIDAIILEVGIIEEAEVTESAIVAKGKWLKGKPTYPIDHIKSTDSVFELKIPLNQ